MRPAITPDSHRTVYLAGPVSNRVDGNRAAFKSTAMTLAHMGFVVISPHEIDIDPSTPWDDAMPVCIAAMMRARAVVVMGGWRSSRGARVEARLARSLGWPVVDTALRHVDWIPSTEGI